MAYALETNRKVFVTFLDVSKAYGTVWIDGLFFKLNKMGIRGTGKEELGQLMQVQKFM